MTLPQRAGASAIKAAPWLLLCVGAAFAVSAGGAWGPQAATALRQDWPPFVLVTGLLLLGQVAWEDGLFQAAGETIANRATRSASLLLAAAVLVALVTAVLNLDTSVAFLTPVLVHAARRRRIPEAPFLYLSIFLANGASLLLPGSNLTNLIVLGHHPEPGSTFAVHMAPVWAAAVVAVSVIVLIAFRRDLAQRPGPADGAVQRPRLGIGLLGVLAAVVAVLVLSPAVMAVVVLGLGVAALGRRVLEGRLALGRALAGLNLPVLVGLLGLAVGLGALGGVWSGPAHLLRQLSTWQAASFAAAVSVLCNNLPAASLLAVRAPPDPYALLVGLNLGPNLVVTGALSGLLWLQVGRLADATPSAARMSRLGLVVVPVSMAAAVGALVLAH